MTGVKNGTVVQASRRENVIIRTDEGGMGRSGQGELDKRGVKIMRDGRPASHPGSHAGDQADGDNRHLDASRGS